MIAPLSHPVLDIFLLGFLAAASLTAGLFFLRFWRDTRDELFFAFAVFFVIQGCSNAAVPQYHPMNLGTMWLFALRLFSILLILAAILRKNFSKS